MFKRLAVFGAILGVLGAALAVGVSYAGPGDIYGSAHDLGSPGSPTCQQCHVPHDAQGNYLWARPPKPAQAGYSLLTDAPTAALCLSCHDGTITQTSAMWLVADTTVNHPMGPSTHLANYGDSYCSACHDAHDGDWRFTKDLMRDGKPPNPDNAQMCLSCHTRAPFDTPDKNHPWATAAMAAPNLPLDGTFDPGAAVADPDGTRLWDSATLKEPVDQGQPGNVTCLSCHGVHGGANEFLTSMTLYDGAGRERLCENCHQ